MLEAGAQVKPWWSQNLIEEHLLEYLGSFLTPTLQPVIVADRGFARASLLRWFLERDRHFVIRFDAETWLHLPDERAAATKPLLALQPGQSCWLPHAYYGKEEKVPVAVLAVWAGGQQEPWYLATNLTCAQTTETVYRWRMRIELANRDEKSGVLLREGGDHHQLTAVLHLHRLLLANLSLHWLAALVGLQAHHDLPDPSAIDPQLEWLPPHSSAPASLAHGPASPPPVLPHRGPRPPLPTWMRRFAARGHLSYVRLGMELLRDSAYALLVRRTIRWLGLYLWPFTPLWRPHHLRYRLKHWWPVPT